MGLLTERETGAVELTARIRREVRSQTTATIARVEALRQAWRRADGTYYRQDSTGQWFRYHADYEQDAWWWEAVPVAAVPPPCNERRVHTKGDATR